MIGSIAAPWECRRHEPDKGDALLTSPMWRIKGYAAHAKVMLLQQAYEAVLICACFLWPCKQDLLQAKLTSRWALQFMGSNESISGAASGVNMSPRALALTMWILL